MSKLVAVILLLVLLASGGSFAQQELYLSERDDLLQLRNSLSSLFNTVRNLYINWTGSPCSGDQSLWFGITCSKSRVAAIDLAGAQLTGSLPPDALQNLWYLTALDLSDNAIHGALPTLKNLIRLRVVSFAGNQFSGSIPTEYLALPNLSQLELQDNMLNGTIPPFDQQALRVFNVSQNSLEGRIPNNSVLQGFPTTSFARNLELCGEPLPKPCSSAPGAAGLPPNGRSPSSATSASGKSLRPWIFVLISIAAVAVVFMGILGFMRYFKRSAKKAKHDPELVKQAKTVECVADANDSSSLMFSEKEKATFDINDLLGSPAELIGKGELACTFRATLESGRVVVVRRLQNIYGMSREEFFRQMDLLGRLRHENLVEIISFHYSKEEKLVVYEHVSGGSLSQLLHDNGREGRIPLKWAARLNIVKGIARGLSHLHQCFPSHKSPHANLKSSNVLIVDGKEFKVKLTDAGFQPLLPSSQIHKLAIGKAPEVSVSDDKRLVLTHKADVYCFGLVLLEIITGRAPSNEEEDLAEWVRSNVSGGLLIEVLDLEIGAEKESHGDAMKLIEVALECVDLDPQRRPTMNDVLKRVEEIRATNDGES